MILLFGFLGPGTSEIYPEAAENLRVDAISEYRKPLPTSFGLEMKYDANVGNKRRLTQSHSFLATLRTKQKPMARSVETYPQVPGFPQPEKIKSQDRNQHRLDPKWKLSTPQGDATPQCGQPEEIAVYFGTFRFDAKQVS